jgi:nucleotide sugar dehydrogenase
MKISIIGLGFVGNAMYDSFKNKIEELQINDLVIYGYDKYRNGGIGTLIECIDSDIIFTALPTLFDEQLKSYDNSPTLEVLNELQNNGYTGIVVIKSTVEPQFTETTSLKFTSMNFIHNPEFLTARTAYDDFHSQKHIVLGKSEKCTINSIEKVKLFYSKLYESSKISECTSTESECMKMFCNTFYAVKIQYFNELYLLSQKIGADYCEIVKLMLGNDWINPMHTNVPGPDGKLSYGGLCFPKDTNALLEFMKTQNTPCAVLNACVTERNTMREQ